MLARAALLLACLAPVCLAQEVPLGTRIEELRFQDIRYLPRTLSDFGEHEAYALVFLTRRCPIAQRYLPELTRLAQDYEPRGVQFVVVNVDFEEDVLSMATHALEHDLPLHVVKDLDARCVKALGITRTPQVAVLDADRVLRYRGRIDDQVRFGGTRQAPTRADLREALDELLAGDPVSLGETPVDGCKLTLPKPHQPAPVTFSRDVAPILQRHCVECHRQGGSAPFALEAYEDVYTLAEMVAEVVADRRMPPWYASGGPAPFENHRGLPDDERRVILDWVAGDTPQGDPAELPPPRPPAVSKWSIGAPDLVIEMPDTIKVLAEGAMPYQYVILPHRFEHDTWVQSIELVAENPEVMHHCNLFFLRPGKRFESSQILSGKVPGGAPLALDPGVAVLIPRGALLGLQIHYQPNGTEARDRVAVGMRYPRVPVQKRFRALLVENKDFVIPPGAPHHRVEARVTFDEEVIAGGVFGHMHLRGKDVTFRASYPDGSAETLLQVPNYDFNWQLAYVFREPRRFPPGTQVEVVAHFDNSRFNPYNPDPSVAVRYGLQTESEMVYCFVYYVRVDEALGIEVDPTSGAPLSEAGE